MSDRPVSMPIPNAQPCASIRDAQPCAMLTLRADLADARLGPALDALCALPVPKPGGIESQGTFTLAWMSPDELLILLPLDQSAQALALLRDRLGDLSHLTTDMSDARAHFVIYGAWRDVVARLSPVDLRDFGPGQIRRTRFGQVAAALWLAEDGAHVICFRSVAAYMRDLLTGAAQSGAL